VQALLDVVAVVPFDESAARVYARVRAEQIEAAGTPLAEPELRIAATALAHGLTLVTGNERHFRRVPVLTLENWLAYRGTAQREPGRRDGSLGRASSVRPT
jgi:tRNA(fMet)-specific endonuclease VapC